MDEMNLRSEDVLHRSYLNRTLIEVMDQPYMAHHLAFKGGTCAAMLGYLDRFSIDLDFDALPNADEQKLREGFIQAFQKLGLELVAAFDQALFFQLRYPNSPGKRNKLKVSASTLYVRANEYIVQYFPDVDRLINSQTLETMFANKLVAVMDRYNQHGTIAGRDIYDVHHFFVMGYAYNQAVIYERTGLQPSDYLRNLVAFIRKNITQRIINEDLNTLLPPKKFQSIRKIMIPETIALLEREIDRCLPL
jgi:predicted nucleotidyltransferase component of viral defense system